MRLSVIGLGKLGACSAACFAYRGFDVMGYDISQRHVDSIQAGVAPVFEPDLQKMIDGSEGRLRATRDPDVVIRESEVSFLIVPTPSTPDGDFSDDALIAALTDLAGALKRNGKEYHLFAITSTVSPTTTMKRLVPVVEEHSGRRLGSGFGICYNPEFIALGSVIRDFLHPDMVLIGEATAEDGEVLQKIYSRVCMNSPHIARMSVVSAEIAKISLNSFVTMKISFANTLAMLCESIPGANIDHITKALGADRRVSPYYFTGGLSYGGPCFPRDNRAFAAFARSLGRDASLALATDVVNQTRVDDVVGRILLSVPKNTTSVSVLGLAYKPDTPVVEESPGIMIAEALVQAGFTVLVYDQLAVEDARQVLRERVTYAASMQECFERSSVIIITTQDSAFKEISGKDVRLEGTMIIDCWRQLDPGSLGDRAMYVPLGIFRETRAETRDG